MESKERLERKRLYMREKQLTDPAFREQRKQYSKKYRARPEVKKKRVKNQIRYERKLKFGITDKDYLELKEKQDNKCAICFTDTPGGRGDWHIDHCHETGKVRGLLCFQCNVGIGFLKDSEILLRRAADYIAKHTQRKDNI